MIEELLVESAQAFQQIGAKEHATARLPVDSSFRIAAPTGVSVRDEYIRQVREGAQVQRGNPVPPKRRKRARRILKRAVGVENLTAERARFGMGVREGHPPVQGPFVNDRVRVQD